MAEKKEKKKKKYKFKLWRLLLTLLLLAIIAFGIRVGIDAKKMYDDAKFAKSELSGLLSDIKSESYEQAHTKVENVHTVIKNVRTILEGPIWKHCDKLPKYGPDFVSGCKLLKIADEMMDTYVEDGFNLLKEHPLSTIKKDNTFNVKALLDYLNFAESAMPDIERVVNEVSDIHISLDEKGLMSKYTQKAKKLIDLFHDAEIYIPFLKAILREGNDSLYIIAAQNSAEIRAGGGFPGSMGTMRIKDGYMSIGDFASVWDVLSYYTADYLISDQEYNMFFGWVQYPRDASYNPYFPKVAEIWAASYEENNGEHVNGVISLTPSIIQSILSCTGPITLDDGTVLDGTNATKFIQSDIYMKYLNADALVYGMDDGNEISDALFANVAQLAMGQVFSNITIDNIPKFLNLVTESIKTRVLMVWSEDSEREEIIKSIGAAGDFNTDPNNPQLGVYFSNSNPSKLGWYLDLDINVGEPTVLDDGSLRYNVSVSMYNSIDWDTTYYAGYYIAGLEMGYLVSYLNLVAPAGGYISGYWMDNGYWMDEEYYMGSQYVYCRNFYIGPQQQVTAYFNVTTAPGVTTPLTVSHTPTLQEYR